MSATSDPITRAIRNAVPSVIYTRGLYYHQQGHVLQCSHESNDTPRTMRILGTVRGTHTYDVTLEYDTETQTFTDLDCTCPYGYGCKHTVAVALTFATSYKTQTLSQAPPLAPTPTTENAQDKVRDALAQLGLEAQAVPDTLIQQLLAFQSSTQPPTTTHATKPPTQAQGRKKKTRVNLSSLLITQSYLNDTTTMYRHCIKMDNSISTQVTRHSWVGRI